MPVFARSTEIPVSAEALYTWHTRPGALERLTPPWESAEILESTGDFANRRVTMKLGPMRWVAQHQNAVEGRQFVDVQASGPFARWVHTHRFEPISADRALLSDSIDYALPLGAVADWVAGGSVAARLDRMFRFRHARTRNDLEQHARFAHQKPWVVAISGASGLVGAALRAFLTMGGHEVRPLVRRSAQPGEIRWDPAKGEIDLAALEGVDAIVHLAGENIGDQRWTPEHKERVLRSRTLGTTLLASAAAKLQKRPRVFLSASAVGYYGDRGEEACTEASAPGRGFLTEVCTAWEASAAPAVEAGIRTVWARIGVVLSSKSGALSKLLPPFSAGAGGVVGSGQQYMSWIHLDDAIGALVHLLGHDDLVGPFNLTAPAPATNALFTATLAHVLSRPALVPLPAFAIRAMFGEMGEELLLKGAKVLPQRLEAAGYPFLFPQLEAALSFELGR